MKGNMITEKQMTLGQNYDGQDPTGWFMSEKLNGIRLYWDGETFWTRGGDEILAPKWFTLGLRADMHLDCELFAGYGTLELARRTVQYGQWPKSCRVCELRLGAFDCTTAPGDWARRMRSAQSGVFNAPFAFAVQVRRCQGLDHLKEVLDSTVALGGEGLVLRNPSVIRYEQGRTANLLKVKPEFIR